MRRVVFDIESDGLLDTITRIWVLCLRDADKDDQPVCRFTDHDPRFPGLAEGLEILKAAEEVIGHNIIGFDLPAIRKVTGLHLDDGARKVTDTLVQGRLLDPERGTHSLDSYGRELGILKGSHEDWSCYSEEMASYCEQDVRVSVQVWKKTRIVETWGQANWLEHYIARLIEMQMANGFRLDVRRATMLAAELHDEVRAVESELAALFPPIYVPAGTMIPKRDNKTAGYVAGAPLTKIVLQEFNAGSTEQIARRLKRMYGWVAPLTDKGNPKVDEAVLKKLDFPEVPTLLKHARVNKLYTQLAGPKKKDGSGGGWIHHTDENDRIHGYVNPNGAVTGRMTHSRPNSANIDKDPRMRSLWVPEVGWVLVGCDAEGLELRMLAHYLYPLDKGEFARALLEGDKALGTDAHSKNRDLAELATRDGAKTLIYGLIYGAGDPKLGAIWLEDWQKSGKAKSEWPRFAFTRDGRLRPLDKIGKVLRTRLEEGITGFGDLVEGVKEAAKKRGWLKGLDGRKTWVRSQHSALNTLLQGGGAIVMKRALILLYESLTAHGLVHGKDYGFCANVHDEWQIECRPEIAQQIGNLGKQAITQAGVELAVRCRLDGAFDVGANWYETH